MSSKQQHRRNNVHPLQWCHMSAIASQITSHLTVYSTVCWGWLNTLRPRLNGHHFADDIFKCIFLNENAWLPIKISLKFVPQGPINNIPALVQIMVWCRPGDKPLSGPMLVRLPTHICVTLPQWVKSKNNESNCRPFMKRDQWIPLTKGQCFWKYFHYMTSLCWFLVMMALWLITKTH